MKILIIFECSRCGSTSFRPSTKWTFKDNFLHKFGITPQRCYRCRRRFYLVRPAFLDVMLRAIAAPPQPETAQTKPVPAPAVPAPKVTHVPVTHVPVKTDVVWSTFVEADQGNGHP